MVNLFIELNYKDFPILAKFYAAGSVIAFHDFHKRITFFMVMTLSNAISLQMFQNKDRTLTHFKKHVLYL